MRQTSFEKYEYRLRNWLDTYDISPFYLACIIFTDRVAIEQSGWCIYKWNTLKFKTQSILLAYFQ